MEKETFKNTLLSLIREMREIPSISKIREFETLTKEEYYDIENYWFMLISLQGCYERIGFVSSFVDYVWEDLDNELIEKVYEGAKRLLEKINYLLINVGMRRFECAHTSRLPVTYASMSKEIKEEVELFWRDIQHCGSKVYSLVTKKL